MRRSSYVLCASGICDSCAVLAVRPWHEDGWSLPGGGVEPGESYAEAAQRELLEETGLWPVKLVPLLQFDEPGRSVRYFWADGLHGRLLSSHEGEAAWVAFRQVRQGPHGFYAEHALLSSPAGTQPSV